MRRAGLGPNFPKEQARREIVLSSWDAAPKECDHCREPTYGTVGAPVEPPANNTRGLPGGCAANRPETANWRMGVSQLHRAKPLRALGANSVSGTEPPGIAARRC